MVNVAENKKKRQTPYLSRAPRLINNNKRSYNSKKTQKSPRSPRARSGLSNKYGDPIQSNNNLED